MISHTKSISVINCVLGNSERRLPSALETKNRRFFCTGSLGYCMVLETCHIALAG